MQKRLKRLSPHDHLDCVIVGHNDMDFRMVQSDLEKTNNYSGAYGDLKANSLNFHGKRVTYMELLNQVLEQARGEPSELDVCEMPHLGAAYMKSFLEKRNLNVEIVNSFTRGKDRLRHLLSFAPNAVAITTTFYVDHGPIIDIVEFVRQYSPGTRIIVGGPHIFNLHSSEDIPTLEFIFGMIGADIYIFDSQGEHTLSLVLEELRKSRDACLDRVPNLTYTYDGTTFRRTRRQVESNDMDENSVDWGRFDNSFYTPTVQTRTARSCAFSCAFCKYPAIAGPLNLTSLEVIESELRAFEENGVKNVVFIDDTFNVPLPRFKQICRMIIKNGFSFDWFSFFRCSNSDDEAFDLMAKSGCKGVFLGIESGDTQVLKLMNKFADVDRYKYGIRSLTERGITTFASIIVGFPGETEQSIKNTIDFLQEAPPTFYRAELYYHYTNVPIHQRAKELGIVGAGYSWKHNSMDWRTAGNFVYEIYNQVKGPAVLPGYMFDFWVIPYLTGKGFKVDQIVEFTRNAQEIMIRSLDDSFPDTSEQERRMEAIFSA